MIWFSIGFESILSWSRAGYAVIISIDTDRVKSTINRNVYDKIKAETRPLQISWTADAVLFCVGFKSVSIATVAT